MMLNIVPGIDLLHLIGQIAGDGLHHVAEGHNPLDGTKLIDHKGKMGAGWRNCSSAERSGSPSGKTSG